MLAKDRVKNGLVIQRTAPLVGANLRHPPGMEPDGIIESNWDEAVDNFDDINLKQEFCLEEFTLRALKSLLQSSKDLSCLLCHRPSSVRYWKNCNPFLYYLASGRMSATTIVSDLNVIFNSVKNINVQ